MSFSDSFSHSFSGIVAELRSAGCVFAEDEARLLMAEARTRSGLTAMVRRRADGHAVHLAPDVGPERRDAHPGAPGGPGAAHAAQQRGGQGTLQAALPGGAAARPAAWRRPTGRPGAVARAVAAPVRGHSTCP